MWQDLRPKANHYLARLDAGERLSRAPIKNKVAPALGAGIVAAQLYTDVKQAPDAESKRKVIIRDLLVVAGIIGGLLGGRAAIKPIQRFFGRWFKSALPKDVHEHAGGSAIERVKGLFKSSAHSHGLAGGIHLQTMAGGAIGGGILGGLVADAINGEDLKRTGGYKLKEGLFQFVGNIGFCTLSIVAVSMAAGALARRIPKMLGRVPFKGGTEKLLNNLSQKETGNLRTLPASATEDFENFLKAVRQEPRALVTNDKLKAYADTPETLFQKHMSHEMKAIFKEPELRPAVEKLVDDMTRAIRSGEDDKARKMYMDFVSNQMKDDLAKVAKTPEALEEVAQERFNVLAERVGIIAGLFTGVIGGAVVSNKINDFLTKKLNLAEGHEVSGLFGGGHHGKGWGEGKLGDRGLYWWDAVLHLDDWPTAFYIAGVHSLEGLINVLYGMSGLLAGTAGTNYAAKLLEKTRTFPKNYRPLHRQPEAFVVFQQHRAR